MEKKTAFILLLLLSFGIQLRAQSNRTDPDQNAPQYRNSVRIPTRDLANFVDTFFHKEMPELHIPGAAFVFVQDGRIVYKAGFGLADRAKQVPVDPDRTKFRVASVSKLFTSTALLQLVEGGAFSLNAGLNATLKSFHVDNPFNKPIKIECLLTHTSGFDHQHIGRYAHAKSGIQPLADYLRTHQPGFIAPPGEIISYSNYGMALAGLLVQEYSGQPFATYVREHIFAPLDMQHSQFEPPDTTDPHLATGYFFQNGAYRSFPPSYPNLAPAGGLISTAEDIAHFMIAHLEDGTFRNHRILKPETVHEMHRRHAWTHQDLPGWCYGFYEDYHNGIRAILHSGDTSGFSSLLYLLPEKHIGFFLVYNASETRLNNDFVEAFFQRYFPVRYASTGWHPSPMAPVDLDKYTGTYQLNLMPHHSIEKFADLEHINPEVEVKAAPPGGLTIRFPDKTWHAVAAGNNLFEVSNRETYVAFRENANGRISQMYLANDRPSTLDKLYFWQTRAFHRSLLLGLKILLILVGMIFFMRAFFIFFKRRNAVLQGLLYLALAGICLANLYFFSFFQTNFDPGLLRFGVSKRLMAALSLPLLTAAATVAVSLLVWTKRRQLRFSLLDKFQFLSFYIVFAVFMLFLNYWNLIGFHF